MGIDDLMEFVVEKLKETVPAIENFGTDLAIANNWIETSSVKIHHQIHTATPFLSAAAVLVVVVYLCGCCCCRLRGGGEARMMKSPGRNSRMPRQGFESNPKEYFRNLRSHSD